MTRETRAVPQGSALSLSEDSFEDCFLQSFQSSRNAKVLLRAHCLIGVIVQISEPLCVTERFVSWVNDTSSFS